MSTSRSFFGPWFAPGAPPPWLAWAILAALLLLILVACGLDSPPQIAGR